jgi:hypothetical protein
MMARMRAVRLRLVAALLLAPAARAAADEWTLIDVKATLANDARVTVVETHHIRFEVTGKKMFVDFGAGADQFARLTAVTRIGPDGEDHRLAAVDTVADGSTDQYRQYEMGHVYFSVPELGKNVAMAYRFEYVLEGAVAPAWAIAAGEAQRVAGEPELIFPWFRVAEVYRDWRRLWPIFGRRYRYDHDVVMPDRKGHHELRQIDYRLEYGTRWRDAEPSREVGAATPTAYRVAKAYDYLGSDVPPHASTGPAAQRLLALILPPIAGVAGWLFLVGAERFRRGSAIDRTFVDTRVLTRSPEEIAFWMHDVPPDLKKMLERMAGEGAISIHVDRPAGHVFGAEDDPQDLRIHMRRLAADATLSPFERDILDDIFGSSRELSSESHAERFAGQDYDPEEAIDRRLPALTRVTGQAIANTGERRGSRWSLARVGLIAVFGIGIANVFRHLGPAFDVAPIAGGWAFFTIAFVNGWPAGWWFRGRPARGLLVPLVTLMVLQWGWLFVPNQPVPAIGWLASAVAVIAGFYVTLARARMPGGEGGVVADLVRMRDYAREELEKARPQLDDRWIPRLQAMGLGPDIDKWRARHMLMGAMPPEHGDRPRITNAQFTGLGPAPWKGPADWLDALLVFADQEEPEDVDPHDDEPVGDTR